MTDTDNVETPEAPEAPQTKKSTIKSILKKALIWGGAISGIAIATILLTKRSSDEDDSDDYIVLEKTTDAEGNETYRDVDDKAYEPVD